MKKQTAAAFIAAMTIATLTACGGPKQLSKSVTVELGNEKGIKVTDILDISKDEAKSAKIDAKKVNFNKEGKYEATITYDKKEYKVTVKIKDTVAPEATVKDSIVVQTGNPVRVTDCISEIKEASGVADAKFKTKPDTAAQVVSTEASTEATASDDSGAVNTEKSSVDAEKSPVSSDDSSTESTKKDASSAVYAVGDVSLSSNDEITYVEAGDYDNSIVVTDNAGNESEVPVKISVIAPPTINGVTDKTITAGESIDYMAGVTATDSKGADITSSVTVDSSAVKTDTAGSYQATYKVTDQYGLTSGATSNVTVNEKPQEESNQAAADNGGSGSNSNSSSGKKNNKKHNSDSQSSGSSNKSNGLSNSGQQASNNNNGGGSSSGGSSAAETPKQDEGDYVTSASGTKLKVDKSKWKYDTSEAGRLGPKGFWANGDIITMSDHEAVGNGDNKDGAKYFLAAGLIPQDFYDGLYGD